MSSPETELALQARPVPEQVAALTVRPKLEPTYTENVIYENSGQTPKPSSVPAPPIPEVPQLAWWQGAGELTLTAQQQEILWQDVNEDEVMIRPDGIVYLPWAKVWKVILQSLSPAVPAIIPIGKPQIQDRTVVQQIVMVVNGKFIGEAHGEARYIPSNRSMSLASCIEAAISDGIVKVSKRLGMFQELWSVPWINVWRQTRAVRAYRTRTQDWQWRRSDDLPFPDEGDPRKSSPGQGVNAPRLDDEIADHMGDLRNE